MDANLLISFDPNHAGKAAEEVKAFLGEKVQFLDSDVGGIFLMKVDGDSKHVVKRVKKECESNPTKFEYTFHWVPIETWCKADIDSIAKEMKKIDAKMDPSKTWKLDLGKRNFKADTVELIMKLTEYINKPKVNLKNPQTIVKVEIIGNTAGVSLLDADELLDVPRIKKEFE